jgi:hypothetical protein
MVVRYGAAGNRQIEVREVAVGGCFNKDVNVIREPCSPVDGVIVEAVAVTRQYADWDTKGSQVANYSIYRFPRWAIIVEEIAGDKQQIVLPRGSKPHGPFKCKQQLVPVLSTFRAQEAKGRVQLNVSSMYQFEHVALIIRRGNGSPADTWRDGLQVNKERIVSSTWVFASSMAWGQLCEYGTKVTCTEVTDVHIVLVGYST